MNNNSHRSSNWPFFFFVDDFLFLFLKNSFNVAKHHVAPLLCWPSTLAIAALLAFFHRGDYLSVQLCFHLCFCHPAQFIVAHILRVDWIENQITEIYQKLLNAQGASTDRESHLPTATAQQRDVTYNFQISVGRHVHPLENLPGALGTRREWSTWGRRQTDWGGYLLINHMTSSHAHFSRLMCHVVWCIKSEKCFGFWPGSWAIKWARLGANIVHVYCAHTCLINMRTALNEFKQSSNLQHRLRIALDFT